MQSELKSPSKFDAEQVDGRFETGAERAAGQINMDAG